MRLYLLLPCLLASCASANQIQEIEETPETIPPATTEGGAGSAAVRSDATAASAKDARPTGSDAAVTGDASQQLYNPGVVDCTSSAAGVLRVCDKKIGVSLKYSAVYPDRYSTQKADYVKELGVNWLRGWWGFNSRSTPFEGRTIAEVKANPNVLDYNAVGSWAGGAGWYEWAAQTGGVFRPVISWFRGTVQSSTTCDKGEYAFDVTPGSKDENLLWVAVFGAAYWANVVNKYSLVAIDVINEPDNCGGNGGTQNTIVGTSRMIQIANDALGYVNGTLASPPKPAIISGPGVLSWYNGKLWLDGALRDQTTLAALGKVSFHAYYAEHWWSEVRDGSAHINQLTGGSKKQWITEWGQWWYPDGYGTREVVAGLATVLPQMGLWNIELASPWALTQWPDVQNGMVRTDGLKTGFYWVTRMYNRALLSEKDMLATSSPNQEGDTTYGWSTRDGKDLYVIYENLGDTDIDLKIDLSAVAAAEGKSADVWRVGPGPSTGEVQDPSTTVSGGAIQLKATGDTYFVVKVNGAGGL